jgi:hypothetical protein
MSGNPGGVGATSRGDDALRWAYDVLTGMGREVVEDPIEIKDRPWSRVVRLTTGDGVVFLKVNRGETTYEPALVALLARLAPDAVAAPLAVAGAWSLTPDGGPTLRDVRGSAPPTVEVMTEVMREYAGLQRVTSTHLEELVAVGVPDLRPATLPAKYDSLLGAAEWIRVGENDGMPPETYARLVAHRPAIVDACERLSASVVPAALQHDDLHDNNVFVSGPAATYRIFDWGDSSVAHPFGTLLISLRSFATAGDLSPDDPAVTRVRDAYLECWTDLAGATELREDARLAVRLAPIGRALSWQRALVDADAEDHLEWGESVSRWLAELLDPDT